MKQEHFDIKKYIAAFILTSAIFLTAFYVSEFFGEKKAEHLKDIEKKISLDILSSETQYDLLKEASCENLGDNVLSKEINELARKIQVVEEERGNSNEQIVYLKDYYALLQIKDYLLSKRVAEKCGKKSVFIIYFYGTETECVKCKEEEYVLDYLRTTYPDLRVYAFDYNSKLSAVDTILSLYKAKGSLPLLIVNGSSHNGFQTREEIVSRLPKTLKTKEELEEESRRASSTEIQTSSSSKKETLYKTGVDAINTLIKTER
jgi:hypothetical protein